MMRERRCVGFADGEEREKKGMKCEINKILVCKAKVNRAQMHDYCSTFVYMQNFASTNVGVFWVKICKINHFLYFAQFCTN